MKEETHANLVREIAKYFDISDRDRDLLVKYTQIPDIEYKKKIFDFKRPDTDDPIEKVIHGLEWMGNAVYQGIEWKHEHCSSAIKNFFINFQSAYNILIIENIKKGKKYKEEIKNLAYAFHYIVDIGTPYHSKRLRDIMDLDNFSKKREELTEEEFNNYYANKSIELGLFICFHFEFEDDVKKFWEIDEFQEEYLKEIKKAVNTIDKPPDFSSINDVIEWFKKYLDNLKENAVGFIDVLQEAYLQEDKESKEKEKKEEKINLEIFKHSKICIYNITLVIALVFSIFFPRKKSMSG